MITGATGFIGSRLLPLLRMKGEVFALVRGRPPDDYPEVHWVEQDLSKPLVYSRLPKDVDIIIHLAQSRFYKEFPEVAKDIFDINVRSTFELLEYSRKIGVNCFVYASSGGVYGLKFMKFGEKSPVNPPNFYQSSKYAAELLIRNYRGFFRTVIFRFFFVYGPGQEGMLIATLVQKVLRGETLTIEGNPGLRINPIYVDDAIRVFGPALDLPKSDLLNVAGEEKVTITDLVDMIEKLSGRKAIVGYTDADPQGALLGDNRRMKEVLKVHPRVPLLEGLKEMVRIQSSGD